jgi:hypothetical protein
MDHVLRRTVPRDSGSGSQEDGSNYQYMGYNIRYDIYLWQQTTIGLVFLTDEIFIFYFGGSLMS